VLLLPLGAPLANGVHTAVTRLVAAGAPIRIDEHHVEGRTAFGAVGQDDSLDGPLDPAVSLTALREQLVAGGMASASASVLATAIADRESVLTIDARGAHSATARGPRPATLFEAAALEDVVGNALRARLPMRSLRIDPAPAGHAHNDCRLEGSTSIIRLLATNGTTLAGRTHALVHEMGHALIAQSKRAGQPYRVGYGQVDYGRFLEADWQVMVDEEALVRAIADAWLLRRRAVGWARTFPGAVDSVGASLDADSLAAWSRARLCQGLGLSFAPVVVRRHRG
jgi:hypothetical protein